MAKPPRAVPKQPPRALVWLRAEDGKHLALIHGHGACFRWNAWNTRTPASGKSQSAKRTEENAALINEGFGKRRPMRRKKLNGGIRDGPPNKT